MVEIEYNDDSADNLEFEFVSSKHKKESKSDDSEQHHVIIEPYEDDEYFDEGDCQESGPNNTSGPASTGNASALYSTRASASTPGDGMQSNELFLKSLQATLDKLTDEKNMRARIKIQEVLYTIAYELEK